MEADQNLAVFMKFFVRLSLALHVLAYLRLVSMLAHRTREIPIRPKLPAPQSLLNLWAPLEHLPSRDTFDHLDNFLHGIHRHRLNQKVNVILIRADLKKLDLVACLYVKADTPSSLIHFRINDRTAVLRRKHQMIQQYRDIVALVDIAAHAPS